MVDKTTLAKDVTITRTSDNQVNLEWKYPPFDIEVACIYLLARDIEYVYRLKLEGVTLHANRETSILNCIYRIQDFIQLELTEGICRIRG